MKYIIKFEQEDGTKCTVVTTGKTRSESLELVLARIERLGISIKKFPSIRKM